MNPLAFVTGDRQRLSGQPLESGAKVFSGFVWKLATYAFTGYGPASLWFLLELLILYLFTRDVYVQLGRRWFWKMTLTTVVVFSLMRMVPGDVLVAKLADQGTLTDAQIEEFREEHGLSDPLVVQYFSWLGNLLTGDLGHSIYTGESIRGSLARAAPVTLPIRPA